MFPLGYHVIWGRDGVCCFLFSTGLWVDNVSSVMTGNSKDTLIVDEEMIKKTVLPSMSASTPVRASRWSCSCKSWIPVIGASAWQLALGIFGRYPQPAVQRTSSAPKKNSNKKIESMNAQVIKDLKYDRRRNDLIRKNELDMLRGLMRQKTVAKRPPESPYSVFMTGDIYGKNGAPRDSDNLGSVKKINRIEAQISGEWLGRNKGRSAFVKSSVGPLSTANRTDGSELDLPLTVLTSQFTEAASSQNFQLQEASVSFAFGDDSAAENLLLAALESESGAYHLTIWIALLEFYRATGARENFEHLALEFATRFERSAPQWFSNSENDHVAPNSTPFTASWSCPSLLDREAVSNMITKLERAPLPWRVDWRGLQTIDSDVANRLSTIFAEWAVKSMHLCFIGGAQLRAILLHSTPLLVRDVSPLWWQLRMRALALMGLSADLERVALDFCITYDISPDSLEVADCVYVELESLTECVIHQPPESDESIWVDSVTSNLADENSEMCQKCIAELAALVGDGANLLLAKLDFRWACADSIVISCRRLMRVDFSTAGNLLNWVIAKREEHCQVQLVDVSRLVYEFLHVVGVTRYATVSTAIE